ncbi:MAG: CinA family nicotinamide mononucleotide deamidase-related protein [Bacteroidetes bacterium]|nr:CinA family nicotinamide mononucleotide deamidase-related protein [Bacteroidota bacterium]
MNAEILTIGDELLIGQTVDTNSAWIGKNLASFGIQITRKTAISDSENEIISAINEAFERVDFLLITGGLGPTKDDITKKTLAKLYDCGFRRDKGITVHLEAIFARRGRQMLEINKQQADVPEICEVLANEEGTAPGMWFDQNGKVLVSMPGVPNEMMHIMENRVFPRIKNRFKTPEILHYTAVTVGVPESLLSKQLEDFEKTLPPHLNLAYLPALNTVKLRLSGRSDDAALLKAEMAGYFDNMCEVCGDAIFVREDISPVKHIARQLIQSNIKISLAESCTGGFIANQLVIEPGISKVFNGSIISYANEIKQHELGVPAEIFSTVGAVSKECAQYMCESALKKFNADIAVSTTGISGPGGATDEKPVGLIYIGIATARGSRVKKYHLFGTREQFMHRAANYAMMLVKDALLQEFDVH